MIFYLFWSVRSQQVAQHVCCVAECVLSGILSVLVMPPRGTFALNGCAKSSIREWYPMFYNPILNHTHVLRCTYELVFPLLVDLFLCFILFFFLLMNIQMNLFHFLFRFFLKIIEYNCLRCFLCVWGIVYIGIMRDEVFNIMIIHHCVRKIKQFSLRGSEYD